MMKLSSVRITNFKSLADTGNLALGQVNVLVGRNNSGKSALIQAIHALQAGSNVGGNDVRLGQSNAAVEIVLTSDRLSELSRHYGPNVKETTVNFSITVGSSNVGNVLGFQYQTDSGLQPRQFLAEEPHNFIYTYLSKRKVRSFDRTVDLRRTRAVSHDLSYLVAKVARLSNPDYMHATEYDELCKAVLGFRVSVHAAEDGQQAGIPVGALGYIPIEAMGDGVSSQLGLITDLCMAGGHLFLIEELENDIHPEGLKTLLNVIVDKSKTNQFIVSTHSNIVTRYLGAASDSKIFEFDLDYKPNEIPTSHIREVKPAAETRVAVLRRLGYELSDLDLWDGWLILEESSAEIIIRYLIPWFVPTLSRVRTVAAGGISRVEPTFEDFRRLFLFAHLEPHYRGRAWVVVDGDDLGQQVVANLRSKYKDWPADRFETWSQPDFEHYYPSRFGQQTEEALAKKHNEKRAAKKNLLDQVKAWCNANLDEARKDFEKSAAEVIKKLKDIDMFLRN